MPLIRVETEVAASPARVFEALSDHESYGRMPGMKVTMIAEGSPERNGVGAVRRIGGAGIRFDEKITAFDRPNSYEYLIVGGVLPLEHKGGKITVSATPSGSHVEWVTDVTFGVPVLGGLLGAVAAPGLRLALRQMLAFARKQAERAEASA